MGFDENRPRLADLENVGRPGRRRGSAARRGSEERKTAAEESPKAKESRADDRERRKESPTAGRQRRGQTTIAGRAPGVRSRTRAGAMEEPASERRRGQADISGDDPDVRGRTQTKLADRSSDRHSRTRAAVTEESARGRGQADASGSERRRTQTNPADRSSDRNAAGVQRQTQGDAPGVRRQTQENAAGGRRRIQEGAAEGRRRAQADSTGQASGRKGKNSGLLKAGIVSLVLVAAVFSALWYFTQCTMADSDVSVFGQKVSWLSPGQAADKIVSQFGQKPVIFYEGGREVYRTTAEKLGYSLDRDALKESLERVKDEEEQAETEEQVGYVITRDAMLAEEALSVDHFGDTARTASEDAYMEYDSSAGAYVIVPEVQGTILDEERLFTYVDTCFRKSIEEQDEDAAGGAVVIELNRNVYRQALVTSESEELTEKVRTLNESLAKYKSASVTYLLGASTEVLDSDTICSWLTITESEVNLDEDKVWEYVTALSEKYDTIYHPRYFRTTGGDTVEITNNEYGFQISQEGEGAQLISDLESGEAVSREPVYAIKGMTRDGTDDLNGSYIEVSLERQHLWLYKDWGLVTETDIISGYPTEERQTLTGAWPIAYKASPYTLTSDIYGYATEVTYWMPFVYGQGLHDATWQAAFGGQLYKTRAGSHGCVNLPLDQAAVIYNTIDGGYPIIIY